MMYEIFWNTSLICEHDQKKLPNRIPESRNNWEIKERHKLKIIKKETWSDRTYLIETEKGEKNGNKEQT